MRVVGKRRSEKASEPQRPTGSPYRTGGDTEDLNNGATEAEEEFGGDGSCGCGGDGSYTNTWEIVRPMYGHSNEGLQPRRAHLRVTLVRSADVQPIILQAPMLWEGNW